MKLLIIIFTIITTIYSQEELLLPINSSQLVIVITDTTESSRGFLYTFERTDSSWIQKDAVPTVLGKNGLGWGRGLHNFTPSDFPIKKEGDGRSPAGLFKLGSAFGYAMPEKMKDLKIPYLHITDVLECIDDTASEYYNQIVSRDQVTPEWQSSEKMKRYGVWYEQGVVIEHNMEMKLKGAGSCIFIHNWASRDETTAGCTEMDPDGLRTLLQWLDSSKNPVIVQLPAFLFRMYSSKWGLPKYFNRGSSTPLSY